MTILMLVVLTACGPGRGDVQTSAPKPEEETSTPAASDESPEKPASLSVWVNDEETQREALESIFTSFEEDTGIQVETTPINMLDQVEALALDGPSGNGPDLFFQPHDRIGNIVLQNLAAPIDLGDAETDYTENALKAVTYEGETYGIPMVVETYATYYNKALVDAPETMEDVTAAAESLTNAANNEYGFLMEAANLYFSYPFFAGFGAYVFGHNEETGYDAADIGLANEGAIEGGQLISSWYENGYIPVEVNPDIINGLFAEGKVGIVINGPWALPDYQKGLGENLGTAPLPKLSNGNVPVSFVGVKSWMVNSYSENQHWAIELAKYISNEENSNHYFEVAGEMPANKSALEGDVITSNEYIQAFAEQVSYGEPMPSIPAMQQVWEPFNNALLFIAQGEDVEASLTDAKNTIQTNIEMSQGQ